MKRIAISILITHFFALYANAQRIWIETEISKNIYKGFSLSVSPQIRFKNGFEVKEYFADTKIEYKFSDYFKAGFGYRLGNNIKKDGDTETFSRFNIDFNTGAKWKGFQPGLRLRFTNANDFGDDNNGAINYLRYKLSLKYPVKKLKIKPYIIYEWFHNLEGKTIDKARLESGLWYKLSKKHRIGAYYRLNNYLGSNKEPLNIIGVSYKFKI